jgi:hypothetical protein
MLDRRHGRGAHRAGVREDRAGAGSPPGGRPAHLRVRHPPRHERPAGASHQAEAGLRRHHGSAGPAAHQPEVLGGRHPAVRLLPGGEGAGRHRGLPERGAREGGRHRAGARRPRPEPRHPGADPNRRRRRGGPGPGQRPRPARDPQRPGDRAGHPRGPGGGRPGLRGAPGGDHLHRGRRPQGDGTEPADHLEPVPGDERVGAQRDGPDHPGRPEDLRRPRRRLRDPGGRDGAGRRPVPPGRQERGPPPHGARCAPPVGRGHDRHRPGRHRRHRLPDLELRQSARRL